MGNKTKHLEMIENIIERMGKNSFQLKGWAVTLVTIIGALSARETDKRFFLLAFIPILAFWAIDSFYLQIERKYKYLYNQVRVKSEYDIDFDLDIKNIDVKRTKMTYWSCLVSKTELLFYGAITLAVLAMAFILKVF